MQRFLEHHRSGHPPKSTEKHCSISHHVLLLLLLLVIIVKNFSLSLSKAKRSHQVNKKEIFSLFVGEGFFFLKWVIDRFGKKKENYGLFTTSLPFVPIPGIPGGLCLQDIVCICWFSVPFLRGHPA